MCLAVDVVGASMNSPACVNDMTPLAGNKFRYYLRLNPMTSDIYCAQVGKSPCSTGSSRRAYQSPMP